jgi:hypothetical protein
MRFPGGRSRAHHEKADLTATPAARAAAALRERHQAATYRPDGPCGTPGFLTSPTHDRRGVLVRHVLGGETFEGIRRPDSAEGTARRWPQIRAYAATLRAAGWQVRERHLPEGPAVLATPPSTPAD